MLKDKYDISNRNKPNKELSKTIADVDKKKTKYCKKKKNKVL